MEELGASEAQKSEILNYEVLIILKANNIFFVKIWVEQQIFKAKELHRYLAKFMSD